MATSGQRRPVLVLGLGNPLWGDDGIGPAAIRVLESCHLAPQVEVLDGGTAGLGLLEIIAERERLLVVDAAEMGRPAGTVVCLQQEDLTRLEEENPLSPHQLGLAEVLAVAGRLDIAPKEVKIFAVQPGFLGWSHELSLPLQQRLPELVAAILGELDGPCT